MRENLKSGSVRDTKQTSMVEYCDTPHIEREEKQGIQSIPNEGGYGVYSTKNHSNSFRWLVLQAEELPNKSMKLTP